MQNYLFVHFRESTTPEGEQVYFALSRDGFHWEILNEGRPILWAYYGEHGVRDMTIVRDRMTGKFHIFATDLSLAYGMRGKYKHSWPEIWEHGSKDFGHWVSEDLVNWSEEEMITLGSEDFGCLWAPDILFDPEQDDYILHWSSYHKRTNYRSGAIYCSRTKDFIHFSEPTLLFERENGDIIDSAMYEENGKFFLFIKSERDPAHVMEYASNHATGPFTRVEAFDRAMSTVQPGKYEAPTAVKLDDGRWALFIDYYGVQGAGQGYVPFIAPSLASGDFVRSDADFSFPYGFKHGTILTITEEEFDRMKAHDWSKVKDMR